MKGRITHALVNPAAGESILEPKIQDMSQRKSRLRKLSTAYFNISGLRGTQQQTYQPLLTTGQTDGQIDAPAFHRTLLHPYTGQPV